MAEIASRESRDWHGGFQSRASLRRSDGNFGVREAGTRAKNALDNDIEPSVFASSRKEDGGCGREGRTVRMGENLESKTLISRASA
jgi:hypothetical protein